MLEIFISYICPNFNSHAISKHYRRDKLTVNTTSTNHDNNGAGWDKVEGSGPKLPTKHDTTMFFFVAWSAPNAILSSIYGRGYSVPIEILNTSTSSAMALASSMAANLSESEHVLFSPGFGQHTLCMARRTSGAPPEAVP